MPVYKVESVKRLEVLVEASCRTEVEQAADATIFDGIDYQDGWVFDDWEIDGISEVSDEPDCGVGRDNTIVHIVDAVPIEDRETMICPHELEVDILGRGCPECEAAEDECVAAEAALMARCHNGDL